VEAELPAARNTAKHAALESRYLFQPTAVDSLGPINSVHLSRFSVALTKMLIAVLKINLLCHLV